MRKIKLICGENSIDTTCAGLSQHIYSRYVVHGLSKRGKEWIDALPNEHEPILVQSSKDTKALDYLSINPLP